MMVFLTKRQHKRTLRSVMARSVRELHADMDTLCLALGAGDGDVIELQPALHRTAAVYPSLSRFRVSPLAGPRAGCVKRKRVTQE